MKNLRGCLSGRSRVWKSGGSPRTYKNLEIAAREGEINLGRNFDTLVEGETRLYPVKTAQGHGLRESTQEETQGEDKSLQV